MSGVRGGRTDPRSQERRWRHLDTCQYRTILHARVPRQSCPKHGIKQVKVPWAEPGSRFTALFECLVINWLQRGCITAVAKLVGLSWDHAAGIRARATARGLARRDQKPVRYVGVDETSYRKGHQYVTVVNDLEEEAVLHVHDGRKQEALDSYWAAMPADHREQVVAVAMDMWEPDIRSTMEHLPGAEEKIVFDKFHVAQHLGDAVDAVRKAEHRELLAAGETWLKRTRYDWLRHPDHFTREAWRAFLKRVGTLNLKTGRAWALKETAMYIWEAIYPAVAERRFNDWYQCNGPARQRHGPWLSQLRKIPDGDLLPLWQTGSLSSTPWDRPMKSATRNPEDPLCVYGKKLKVQGGFP